MICYASRTGTHRNLEALRAAGWRLLISRVGEWKTSGFRYALENGAWSDFQQKKPFDADRFELLLDRFGGGADWVVLPDIVAGGLQSLALSIRWFNRCLGACPLVLIAVQDGMTQADLAPLVGPNIGIFLGGSTEWKLSTMANWGEFCAAKGVYYHVARVNTRKRFRCAHAAGANSVDGSSATRFSKTMPLLQYSASERDLFTPART